MNFKILTGLLIVSLSSSPAKPELPTTDQITKGAFIIAACTGTAFLYSAWKVYQQECIALHQEPSHREFWNFIKDFIQENNLTKTFKTNPAHPRLVKLCLATQAAAGTGTAALAVHGIKIALQERPNHQRSRPGSSLSMQSSINSSAPDLQSNSSGSSELTTDPSASRNRRAEALRRRRESEDAASALAAQKIEERRASIHNRELQGPNRAQEEARAAAALADLAQQIQAREDEQRTLAQAHEQRQKARDEANRLEDKRMGKK